MQLGEDLRAQVAESGAAGARGRPGRRSASGSRCTGPSTRRARGGADRRRPGDVPGQGGGPQPDRALPRPRRAAAQAAPPADDLGEDPRRDHPRSPQPLLAADPQPRLGRDRALRAAAADDRRRRRAAAGRLLHRGGGALRDGPGARPLGRRPGPRAARPPRARGGSRLPARQSLRRLARRSLGARVHRAPARRRRRRPRPLHLRDHGDGADRRLRRRAASPTGSPSSAARSRSTTTAPASAPSTT